LFFTEALILIILLGFLSFLLTWMIRNYALRRKMVALPNERSLHDIPTPFGGGIAIVITWYAGLVVFYFSGVVDREFFLALMSGVLLAVVSFIDDIIDIKPAIRLFVHFVTAILAFWLLGGLRALILPGFETNYQFIIYPVAIVGMVWFINLFNFMDGVDGFASVEAIIICSVLFVFTWDLTTLLLIFCVSGFLYWNWPKAKIFMGDVGSTQLGFIIVVMGIHFHNAFDFSILNWIMITSPFWFDATLTLFRRWRNGEKLSTGHRKHVYQRIVQAGYSHLEVIYFLVVINIVIILLIAVYREIKVLQVPLFILTLVFYYLITLSVDRKVPFSKD
jgi:Fuc2NAc and GlcNAc transferase